MQNLLQTNKLETPTPKTKSHHLARADRPKAEVTQLKKYLLYLPELLLGIMGYAIAWFILQNIFPHEVRDIGISNSYLPLLSITAVAHFFFFSYITLDLVYGLLFSLCLTIFFALRLFGFHHPVNLLFIFLPLARIVLLTRFKRER